MLQELRLKAGFAVAIFAFNNTALQYTFREAGGISYNCFDEFLQSDNDYFQCHAAFQVRSDYHVSYSHTTVKMILHMILSGLSSRNLLRCSYKIICYGISVSRIGQGDCRQ